MISRYFVALLAVFALQAETPAAKQTITLMTGRGELLQFPADVKGVAASEPKIADVVVISPREVMVNAKEVGKTTVVIWGEAGPIRYDVNVTADTTEFDNFKTALKEQLPGAEIEITGKGETIVLKGTAKDAAQVKLAGAIAETRAKTVVNLITAPPGPEPRQIVLHVKFASVDLTLLKQLGLNIFSRNGFLTGESTTGQFQSPRFSQLQPTGDQSVNFADLLNLFVYRPDIGVGATIQALQEKDILQVLAEPNLMTVEGKTASFLAGGSFPFPVLTTTSTGGSVSPVITVQFKPFGVKLDFTPTVTPTGAIHLQVSPEVSSLDYSNAVTLQGFLIPALSQRKMDTEVELKDGETFAIAGLLDRRVQQTMDKLPWFGDIPIIGQLFSSKSTKKTNTELLVLITPHFVKPLGAGEKPKMIDFPINFLPTAEEAKAKADAAKDPKKKGAEFVGPHGEQEPKPQQ
jgi:pilus assembly protein CpaC